MGPYGGLEAAVKGRCPYCTSDYRPVCSLSLTREPDLTEFYVSTYTESLELHDQLHYTVLPGKLEIPLHYIKHPTAKYLPTALKPLVQADNEYIVWRDAPRSLSLYCSHYLGSFDADESEWGAI